jgi:hypothetical protein
MQARQPVQEPVQAGRNQASVEGEFAMKLNSMICLAVAFLLVFSGNAQAGKRAIREDVGSHVLTDPTAAEFYAANPPPIGKAPTSGTSDYTLSIPDPVIIEATVNTSGSTGINVAGESYTALTLGTAAAPYTRTVSLSRANGRYARIYASWLDQKPTLEVYDGSPSGTLLFSATNSGATAKAMLEFYRTSGSTAWAAAGPNIVFASGTVEPVISGTDGMLAFYRLSDGTDQTGNFALSGSGSPTYGAGKIGNAVILEGTSFLANETLTLTGSTAFTVTGWVNADLETSGSVADLFGKFSGGDGYQMTVGIRPHDPGDGEVATVVSNIYVNGDGKVTWMDGNAIPQSTWCFIAVRYASTSGSVETRVNAGAWVGIAATGTISHSGAPFCVGVLNAESPSTMGLVDALGVWGRRLSDAEVDALYLSGTGAEF